MSIAEILSSSHSANPINSAGAAYQQLQQLSRALKSNNLSAAQTSFATLQQAFSQTSTAAPAANASAATNVAAQDFNQLAADLKSGNLASAQTDFASIQKDLQSQGASHFRHHGHIGSGGSSGQNALIQDLSQAGQGAVPSVSQSPYTALQQQIQQFAQGASLSSSASALQEQPPLSLVA